MAMTQVEKFYRALLNSIGVAIDDKNHSMLLYGYGENGSFEPVRIDGKTVVLPTTPNLKQEPDFWEGKISFHPMVEQLFRDESKVFRTLQSLLNWKLINSLAYVAKNLAIIASHDKITKEFNPVQHVLLDALKNTDAKTVKYLTDVLDSSFSGDKSNRLISTAIKQGGHYKGKQYSAVLITLFSIYDNVNYDNKSIFNVKTKRNSDLEQIVNLFKFILPQSDVVDKGEYDFGSNSKTAPRLHSMLHGYIKVAERLNAIMHLYGEFIEGIEEEIIDTEWSDYLDQFDELKHNIPILEDNFGDITDINPDSQSDSGKKISSVLNNNEPNSADDVPKKAHYTNPNRSTLSTNENSNRNNTMNDYMQQMMMQGMMQNMMQNMTNNNNGSSNSKKGSENNNMNMNDFMQQQMQMQMMQQMMGGGNVDNNSMKNMQMMQMLQNENTKQFAAMQIMNDEDASPMLKNMAMCVAMGNGNGMMNPMMGMGNMFGNNDGNNDSNPMMQMMQQMQMNQMMQNMMNSGGDNSNNPMMQMMQFNQMNQMMQNMFGKKKANEGETVTPEQPTPKKSK